MTEAAVWPAVERLVDRAPGLDDLRVHGIYLFAARRWRAEGRPVPEILEREERTAAVRSLAAHTVLERVRAACDGPILLVKGPAAAAYYPDPALRPFADLDLIVPDAHEAHRALLGTGFDPVGEEGRYRDIHHLRPLQWGPLPLAVELHERPKWLDGLPAPSGKELLSLAVPASLDVDGILMLPPAHHAVLMAVHSWAHTPLRRVLDLVDVAALVSGLPPEDAGEVAAEWGVRTLWRTTARAAESLLAGGRRTLPLRTWARNLPACRDRTVLENHLMRLTSNLWARPVGTGLRLSGRALVDDLRPAPGESWGAKLGRTGRALVNASGRLSEHEPG